MVGMSSREPPEATAPSAPAARVCNMLEGVKSYRDESVKDCIVLEGNDIDNVSKSAALIHMAVSYTHLTLPTKA